jgi:hypothetical protein
MPIPLKPSDSPRATECRPTTIGTGSPCHVVTQSAAARHSSASSQISSPTHSGDGDWNARMCGGSAHQHGGVASRIFACGARAAGKDQSVYQFPSHFPSNVPVNSHQPSPEEASVRITENHS